MKSKRCPFCGGEIPPQVVKCMHCGEFLDGRQRADQPPPQQAGANQATMKCPKCKQQVVPQISDTSVCLGKANCCVASPLTVLVAS